MLHREWFSVDVQKRAAVVRSRHLGVVLKEVLANSLDAGARQIDLTCNITEGTRRDGDGMRSFHVECLDNGSGCDDPQVLRRVGSTTSDLHAEKRGRFGQGLIDVLVVSDFAEIRTLRHRLVFDKTGCKISRVRQSVDGLHIVASLRHSGEGFEGLGNYYDSMIVPDGVEVRFNGRLIERRQTVRVISGIRLQTVVFDTESERVRKYQRTTDVEVYTQFDDSPMIYELGIPIDVAPWGLPFDINVLQKTPLDTDRNMLPDKYKAHLISQLVEPMSDEYASYMAEHDDAPPEIRDDRENATRLTDEAQQVLIEKITGAKRETVVRRNPLDSDDVSESQELESEGFAPVNRGSLPAGVSELLRDAATVAETHDRLCKPHFRRDANFPSETDRQRRCMAAFAKIASALVGKRVRCERVRGNSVAATYGHGVLRLNIDVDHIWTAPSASSRSG